VGLSIYLEEYQIVCLQQYEK